jgi:hypothetical protein
MSGHRQNPEASSFSLPLRQIASWHDIPGLTEKPEVRASVPVLQRGLVWNPDQIELLWDSILRGFPIGAIVLSAKITGQTKVRDEKDSSITHHLLDGQQRCDAIALGFKDPFSGWIWIRLPTSGARESSSCGSPLRHTPGATLGTMMPNRWEQTRFGNA